MNTVTDAMIRDLFTSQNKRHEEVTAAIAGYNLNGYPVFMPNIMEANMLNRFAAMNGMDDPDYYTNPLEVHTRAMREFGVSMCDQYMPNGAMTMTTKGYEDYDRTATTGLQKIVVDGMTIEEPEDVIEHLERFAFPALKQRIENFNKEECIRQIGLSEYNAQLQMGLDVLKTGYHWDFSEIPMLPYGTYGYENYFCAYLLYEDVMAEHFKLQAEYARKKNEAVAEAYKRYNLPNLMRLDHDLTDSRGTIVDVKSLDRIWFPQLTYALEPLLKAGIRLIWHCDGNIMPMVPRLLDIGIKGFQGFQYEDGVNFAELCKLHGNDGQPLFMIAGVSVTKTLPFGKPADVRAEMDYLVEVHGDTALTLGCSSSVAPGVSAENLDALREGFRYYRTHRK